MLWDIIWNKSEFPGLLKEVHNPIPVHFGCTNNKPLLDTPCLKETNNCNKLEGAQLLLALIDVEDGLLPPDIEVPLPLLPDKSDNSNIEDNAAVTDQPVTCSLDPCPRLPDPHVPSPAP
jgi:hypothetical protein